LALFLAGAFLAGAFLTVLALDVAAEVFFDATFLAGAFLAGAFLVGDFLTVLALDAAAEVFFAATFLAGAFFAVVLVAGDFLAVVLVAGAFLAVALVAGDFLAAFTALPAVLATVAVAFLVVLFAALTALPAGDFALLLLVVVLLAAGFAAVDFVADFFCAAGTCASWSVIVRRGAGARCRTADTVAPACDLDNNKARRKRNRKNRPACRIASQEAPGIVHSLVWGRIPSRHRGFVPLPSTNQDPRP
jgi:hypothetical protein